MGRQKYSYSPNLNLGTTTSLAQQQMALLVKEDEEDQLQRSKNIQYATIGAQNVWKLYTQAQEKEVTKLLNLKDPEGVSLFKRSPKRALLTKHEC